MLKKRVTTCQIHRTIETFCYCHILFISFGTDQDYEMIHEITCLANFAMQNKFALDSSSMKRLSNRLFKPFLVSKIEKFGIVGKRSSFILYESYKIGREKISNPKKFYGSKGGSSFYDIAGSTIIFNPFEHMFMNQNL